MKRILQIMVLMIISLMVLTVSASATVDCLAEGYDFPKDGNVGSPNEECQKYGFDFGIAKFECGDEKASDGDGTGINVDWTGCASVEWSSNFPVTGVLHKASICYVNESGGVEGLIQKLTYDISHITFCGNEGQEPFCGDGNVDEAEECDDGNNDNNDSCRNDCSFPRSDVPEFGVVAAGLALAGAGVYIARKRKK